MAKRKELFKSVSLLSLQRVSRFITRIKTRLNSDRYYKLNEGNESIVEQIREKLFKTEYLLKGVSSSWVSIRGVKSIGDIELLWEEFDMQYTGVISDGIKSLYKDLLKTTDDFLTSFDIAQMDNPLNITIRNKSTQDEQSRLESLNKRRFEVKDLYEQALEDDPLDEEKVQKLKAQLDTLEGTLLETKKNLDDIKIDSAEEERMRKRIDDAFNFLSNDNHLENELTKLRWEYYVMLSLITLTIILFLIFYGVFLYHFKTLKLTGWCEYLPYTMSVPLFIGLLWLFVYLKNRASKISIELSSRLYDIRYLEGLMKMINSMSGTSVDAVRNIEELTHSLVDSFLNKMSEKSLKEKDLSVMEKQELESSPYWRFLCEFKELISLIKK